MFFQTLHPMAAMAYGFVLAAAAVILGNPVQLTVLFLLVCLALLTSRLFTSWLKTVKYLVGLVCIFFILNVLVNGSGLTVLASWPHVPLVGRIRITLEAVVFGLTSGLRLILIYGVFYLVGSIVSSDEVLAAASRWMPKSALLLAMTTKTIPSLVRRVSSVTDACRIRGAPLGKGTYLTRVRGFAPVLRNVLVLSLEDSFTIGEAISCRGYTAGPRTRLKEPDMRRRDAAVLVSVFGSAVCLAVGVWHGAFSYRYFPRLTGAAGLGGHDYAYWGLTLFLFVPVFLSWGWEIWCCMNWKA